MNVQYPLSGEDLARKRGKDGKAHYCLGASLARTQLRSIFSELIRVIPDIEADEPELLRSAFIHGVKRMNCSFRARA